MVKLGISSYDVLLSLPIHGGNYTRLLNTVWSVRLNEYSDYRAEYKAQVLHRALVCFTQPVPQHPLSEPLYAKNIP